MNRFPIQLAAAAGLIGGLCLLTYAGRQGTAAPAATPRAGTTRVAFVDIGHILLNYKKLEDMKESVKEFQNQAEAKAKAIVEKGRKLDAELKSGDFEDGSPEFVERESALFQISSRLEVFKQSTKKELSRKEAAILRDVYLEIQAALREFADVNGYSLILQINREAMTSEDLGLVKQKLVSPVVFNGGGNDITDAALEYLSSKYVPTTPDPKPAAPAAAPAKTAPRKSAAAPAPGAKATR